VIALGIAGQIGVSAYIADPVCVDEFEDIARISGLKEIERPALSPVLNTRATLFKYAEEVHKGISEMNVVIGHLGGGISITAIKKGKMVDVSGALPTARLIKFCLRSGMSEKQLLDYVTKKVTEMIDSGNTDAKLVFDAMCYQIAKEIGAMATVLKGSAEAILLTGGMAFDKTLVSEVSERVAWIAPVKVYPGEEELEVLEAGSEEEKARIAVETVKQGGVLLKGTTKTAILMKAALNKEWGLRSGEIMTSLTCRKPSTPRFSRR
jgi:butyrate kinase